HRGGRPVPGGVGEPQRMNSRVLVLVLDLIAAFPGAGGKGDLVAEDLATARRGERIAQAAETGGEIAGRLRAGREMLMELLVGGREDDAVLPVDAHEIPIALVPHQRKSAAACALVPGPGSRYARPGQVCGLAPARAHRR